MEPARAWHGVLATLLHQAHLAGPDRLSDLIDAAARPLGVRIDLYLVDVEQRRLRALPPARDAAAELLSIDGTMAGRAFTTIRLVAVGGRPARLWTPVVDGTERLGVLNVELPDQMSPDDPAVREGCVLLAGLVGHLVMSKRAYGDTLHRIRRNAPMATSAELLWQMLPPLTFATGRLGLSAMLEPCYDVGGDGFDYAVDHSVAYLAVLDAVGRGLGASMTCAVALSALRAARRAGEGLAAMARTADAALAAEFTDFRFVTAILAELDERTGRLRYLNAGHPAPLLLRGGRAVLTLGGGRRVPLGLGNAPAEVGEAALEPGDRLLLYTDGVVDARRGDARSGLTHLVDLARRYSAAGLPVAEVLRRLSHATLDQHDGRLRDDATLLLVEWSAQAARRSVPAEDVPGGDVPGGDVPGGDVPGERRERDS